MAHALAYLRFAGTVTGTVARLATGWAGSPLAGRVSHPLDDYSKFREVIASLLSSSTGIARPQLCAKADKAREGADVQASRCAGAAPTLM